MSLHIPRARVNEILAKAISIETGGCLCGLYHLAEQKCEFYTFEPQFEVSELLNYAMIYNQSVAMQDVVERFQAKALDQQILLEVFEDTEGVIGVRAYQKSAKMLSPLELELTS
ncbi:MAG: hypothetical protein ISR69_06560 [Gammaproteobacteria bacterium]|nr:hypothetical protein [Gammaproteobacteria bacterium]